MAAISFYGPLGAGHVNPTLGIVAELVRRGHTVTYYAPRRFADGVAETGADFVPVVSTWEAMGSGSVPQMHGRDLIRGMGLLLEETKALVPVLAEARPPDLVVHDGTLAPNFVSNRHWSMNRYAKINPLSPRFLAIEDVLNRR